MYPNTALQTGVDYATKARPGAFVGVVPNAIDSVEFGENVTAGDVFTMGGAVVLDTDGGVRLPTTGDTVFEGFVTYKNDGIIDYTGYEEGGLYKSIPIIRFGRIYLPVKTGETILVGDAISLYIGAGADFNTIEKTPLAPGANDISLTAQAVVAQNSEDGCVLVSIFQYIR